MEKLFTTFFLISFGICSGQNLIPNGDFEQFYHCPNFVDQIDSAKYWWQATNGTADYYNQCDNGIANVPFSKGGYQLAHSGVAYAGIITWYNKANPWQNCYRDYIEVELNSPLVANECYHFRMFINLFNYCKYTTDDLGILFSDTLIHYSITYNLPLSPQIQNIAGNITDTLNWTLVSGDYIAHGGEKYLTIGNFKNDNTTDTIVYNNSVGNGSGIYIYIDDVSLYVCGTNGITSHNYSNNVIIFPNPIFDFLTVNIDNNLPTEFILYDIFSKQQILKTFINSTIINTSQLKPGIYLYGLKNKNGILKTGKVIKY
jgi:hypothetical protein